MAVALAWQSYGNATRETASLKAISLDRDAVRQSLDRIAASVATGQEQMMRSIDRLVAGQEQTTREISDLQTVEQYILERLSTLQTRLAPTTASKPVPRSPQAAMVRSNIP